jgi:phosphoribosylglycinamide formyltransferase-1
MQQIGVLVSGNGSNLQALIDASNNRDLPAAIGVVISNKPGVYALERARQNRIPHRVIDHRRYPSSREFSQAILDCLTEHQIDLICLAGFLRILDSCVITAYPRRILNIHPALLPAFGGKGMYGHHVHEAVIASGAKYSGATVHLVTPETDIGPIVCQGLVEVEDNDTPDSLARKVLQIEHRIYPRAAKLILDDSIVIEGLRVKQRIDKRNIKRS